VEAHARQPRDRVEQCRHVLSRIEVGDAENRRSLRGNSRRVFQRLAPAREIDRLRHDAQQLRIEPVIHDKALGRMAARRQDAIRALDVPPFEKGFRREAQPRNPALEGCLFGDDAFDRGDVEGF